MDAVTGETDEITGVEGGEDLVRFIEASVGDDPAALVDRRNAVLERFCADVVVDIAGVASVFQMMNRLANATGTPLDTDLIDMTAGVRADLGIDAYQSAQDLDGQT